MDNRATGRRIGRLTGEVDGMGLELAAMEAAERASATPDRTVLDHINDATDALANVAGSLEDLVTHINTRDRTSRRES